MLTKSGHNTALVNVDSVLRFDPTIVSLPNIKIPIDGGRGKTIEPRCLLAFSDLRLYGRMPFHEPG